MDNDPQGEPEPEAPGLFYDDPPDVVLVRREPYVPPGDPVFREPVIETDEFLPQSAPVLYTMTGEPLGQMVLQKPSNVIFFTGVGLALWWALRQR